MIRYALVCDSEHQFEAWFSSSDGYDQQAASGLVHCPFCASPRVRKQIMAPAVSGTKRTASTDAPLTEMRTMMLEAARKIREHVEDNFDYVGDAFAREARAIHEGTSDHRDIYGEATPAEVRGLVEDGVPVAPLPQLPPPPEKLN